MTRFLESIDMTSSTFKCKVTVCLENADFIDIMHFGYRSVLIVNVINNIIKVYREIMIVMVYALEIFVTTKIQVAVVNVN